MNDLFSHILSISEQLNALMTHQDSSSAAVNISMPKTTLESLKQSVADTLRLFVSDNEHGDYQSGCNDEKDASELEPTTPPLDQEGNAASCESVANSGEVETKERDDDTNGENNENDVVNNTRSPNKRRKTCSPPGPKRNSTRVAERCLPDCLRDLEHPTISDYKHTKIGSFMAANIMVMNLQKLQPKAEVVAMISRGAVLLLHEAMLSRPEILNESGENNRGGLASLTAAAFWILAKFGGVRALTPDASLMSMTAGIQKEQLFAAEMIVMDALKWDIVSPLRRHGHLDALVL